MAEFVRHTSCESCGSSDANALYSNGTTYCFACEKSTFPEGYFKDNTDDSKKVIKTVKVQASTKVSDLAPEKIQEINNKKEKVLASKEVLSAEDHEEIKNRSAFEANNYRSIRDDVCKFYGCRTELNSEGEVKNRYYPSTVNDQLTGYKIRKHPKTFSTEGLVGNTSDLYGAFRFRAGGKYVLIVGGEEDAHAAYQMMLDYSRSKNSDYVTAVVSVSVGEGNPSKQLANNYEFLNSFEHIVLGFDSDEVGRNTVEKCIGALPKGKVRVANWTKAKDPNEYLERGDSKTFLRDFYAAETYLPAGVLGSDKLYEKIMQQTFEKKVSFPPFMKQLNTMLAGGLPLGHIVNLAAATSIGKTTLVNELIYFWLFNSPHKVGVVSLESDAGQYGESLLSRHLSKKLSLIADEEEKRNYLSSSDVKQAAEILFQTQDGDPRFYLVDDRDGTVEQLQEVIEQMVISSGCKIVIVDPIQDIFAGLTIEEQESFMKWCKSMIKSHKITFVLVNHIRKSVSGDKSRISENDIHGSSTLIKSASINILLSRDKMSEDENIRNTTEIDLPKNRVCGITGPAGAIYYDNLSHTLFDYEDYFGEPYVKPVQSKH